MPRSAMLIDAEYLDAHWLYTFDPKTTATGKFELEDGKSVDTQMMSNQANYGYAESAKLQVLKIPYEAELSMWIFLPRSGHSVSSIQMDARDFFHRASLEPKLVHLRIPKFKFSTEGSLMSFLQKFGLASVFGQGALQKVSGSDETYVNEVLQDAVVEVNEKGTKAAAVTAIQMTDGIGDPEVPMPIQFNAYHPFLFAIRHDSTGAILFIGRLMKPTDAVK